ncbi:MAG: hypothetical protein P4K80_08100 [Acidobacteriaceae bacterium]|nr:hypothetical protein [Acidobacteriaceae bacterium]
MMVVIDRALLHVTGDGRVSVQMRLSLTFMYMRIIVACLAIYINGRNARFVDLRVQVRMVFVREYWQYFQNIGRQRADYFRLKIYCSIFFFRIRHKIQGLFEYYVRLPLKGAGYTTSPSWFGPCLAIIQNVRGIQYLATQFSLPEQQRRLGQARGNNHDPCKTVREHIQFRRRIHHGDTEDCILWQGRNR